MPGPPAMPIARPSATVRRLPLADEGREILREVDRLGHLGRLRVELRELLGLGWRTFRLAPQHQPGRPPRGQGLARGLGHCRQGLAWAAVPGGQALRLTQTAGIGRHHAALHRHRLVARSDLKLVAEGQDPRARAGNRLPGRLGHVEVVLEGVLGVNLHQGHIQLRLRGHHLAVVAGAIIGVDAQIARVEDVVIDR